MDDQVGVLKSELEKMSLENQRLKEMLNEATNNYNGLQMHFLRMMQNESEGKNMSGGMLPRELVDLEMEDQRPESKVARRSVEEATMMRKARVSVRARSEEPMVRRRI